MYLLLSSVVVAFNCLSSSLMSPSSPTSEALPSLDPGIPGPCRRDTDINVPFPDHLEGGGRPCLSLQSARWASAAHRRQRWIQGAPVQSTAWVHAACRHSPLQSIMWVQPIAACSSAHGHMKYAMTSMYTWFREQNISVRFSVFLLQFTTHSYHFTLFLMGIFGAMNYSIRYF